MYVFKFGGGNGLNLTSLANDTAKLAKSGQKIIIVSGGNAALDCAMRAAKMEPKIITSERGEKSRLTDDKTLALLKKVYGKIAEEIAEKICAAGAKAIALIGSDENLILGARHKKLRIVENNKRKVIAGDLTGRINSVDALRLHNFLKNNIIPVIYPPIKADTGEEINADGDKIASSIAIAFKAKKLIFFANTPGLLANLKDEKSLIKKIPITEANNFAIGRMKKKVLAAARAIEAGVGKVIFTDGRIEKMPIQKALADNGTVVN